MKKLDKVKLLKKHGFKNLAKYTESGLINPSNKTIKFYIEAKRKGGIGYNLEL